MDRAVTRLFSLLPVASRSPKPELSSAAIRKTFTDFFEQNHDHLLIPSSPVSPLSDPSLAFSNAGMNQFKHVFLGLVKPAHTRVVNSQKCIRITGKHNDIDQVGKDGTHHTFFEMLGNWSFGDYFKRDACAMAWELLTKVYKIPPDRLFVTYFAGNEEAGLEPDVETKEIWKDIGLDESRVLPFDMKDNFWEMGSTGPCGPSTEIHYDHAGTGNPTLVNSGSPGMVELWNLVFIQYERTESAGLKKLRERFVDTGMGFERLVAILQGKSSNYETDLFHPLFETIKNLSGHTGYAGSDSLEDVAYRVLADHARMITVSLSDGVYPNVSYKLRGVLRRAFNISRTVFKVEHGLLKELSCRVSDALSEAYPNIGENLSEIHYMLKQEESAFFAKETKAFSKWVEIIKSYPELAEITKNNRSELVSGFRLIEEIIKKRQRSIRGSEMWILYDRYGISKELCFDIIKALNLSYDELEYKNFMVKVLDLQKENMKAKSVRGYDIDEALMENCAKVDLGEQKDYFAYDYRRGEDGSLILKPQSTTIQAIFQKEQVLDKIDFANLRNPSFQLVLDRTNFPPKTKRQLPCSGTVVFDENIVGIVTEVRHIGSHIVHNVKFPRKTKVGEISVNTSGVLHPNPERLEAIMRSNTAILILSEILSRRKALNRRLYYCADLDSLTYRYSYYNEPLSKEDFSDVENSFKEIIAKPATVTRKVYDWKDFRKLKNISIREPDYFIESTVPVVEISGPNIQVSEPNYGIHLLDVTEVKDFVIVNQENISNRVKELKALTGPEAEKARKIGESYMTEYQELKRIRDPNDPNSISEHVDKLTNLVKKLDLEDTVPLTVKLEILKNTMPLLRNIKSLLRKIEPNRMKL